MAAGKGDVVMSISKDKSSVMYVGNGVTTEFPFDFKVWEPSHILVTQADAEGVESDVTSQCSVMVTETGGTVSLPSPLPVGCKLHIRRAMPFIQEDRYVTGTRFDPHEIEDALDVACAERQELREQTGRAVKVPVTSDKTPDQYMSAFWQAVKNVLASIVEAGKNIGNSTYVTSTGSDTPRTLADRFGDVVNVKDFGAKGDGVTDDSIAIINAISAAISAGAGVFFPHGKYVTGSAVSGLSSVALCGDGVIVADDNYYYVNNHGDHENVLYVSPDGTEDGLSVSRPTTLEYAWSMLQKVGFLSGKWKIKCSAGTYTIDELLKNVRVQEQSALTLEGEELTGDYKEKESYPTKFTTSKKDPYSHILSFYSVTSINLRYIFFEHSLDVDSGCCVVMAYDTVRCIISSCYLLNGTWCGVNFQSTGTAVVEGSVIDGGDKSRSTYGIEAYNCIVSTGPTERNIIKNYAIGCHAQGQAYFHNDANDFINCDTGYSGGFQAHIEDNSNTYTQCNYNALFRHGAGGSTASVSNGEKVMATFGLVSIKDNDAAQYWPGVFAYHLGTRGRMTLFDGRLNNSLFQRLCINLGDSDIESSIAQYLGSQLAFYDATNNTTNINFLGKTYRNGFYNTSGSLIGYRQFTTLYGGQDTITIGDSSPFRVTPTELGPGDDNKVNAGNSLRRYANIYAASGSISTSDENEKQDIEAYPDEVLDAWGEVELRQFLFRDAVSAKGDAARIHAGVVAQQVMEAFEKHGLDATRYGLLCYDEWEDEYETVEVEDTPAVLDSEGNEVAPAKTHMEQRCVVEAGSRYGIRYSEALCMEAAYQRRRADRLEARIAALEAKLK